jgi:rRNA maturation endonuclease Nob1
MEEHRVSPQDYRRAVLAYEWLPTLAGFVLVGIFLAAFFLTGSYVLSALAAVALSLLLLWRWVLAGRQIDRCPKCSNTFPKKMYWTYPPRVCASCGERLQQ